ncbi:hypothetical protein [Kitasatospora sp. NPDC057198]|uniref:hypothetical protein n=1 Tax=Kitasatospora sp. NPDC057198 TaxID=3346046 RepID=UPI00363E58C1
MSTTDEHPAPPAEQRAGHGASTEVRELLEAHAALGQLPRVLAVRLASALRALERGTVEVLDHADTASLADPARGTPSERAQPPTPGADEEAVVLVDGAGSRAEVAPDGLAALEWGVRALWAQAEAVHARWTAAGRPAVYGVEFDGGRVRVVGGAALSWELPVS